MSELIVYCDGGFGNRFNALVSGLLLARRTGRAPLFVWPVNNWCGAAFGELFDMDLPVVDRELVTFMSGRDRQAYLMVEDRLGLSQGRAEGWTDPRALPDWAALDAYAAATRDPIFYYTALIPGFMPEPEVLEQVRRLRLRPAILRRAANFLAEHGLGTTTGDFIGIQIRKTDFGPQGADDESLFGLVARASGLRYFVCSDDALVEQRFAQLPHVAIHRKRAHVEKMVDGGWNAVTTDHSGRLYPFNVNRSAESVQDAVVDLLILSRSRMVKTSNSTFLQTALRLQGSGFWSQAEQALDEPARESDSSVCA